MSLPASEQGLSLMSLRGNWQIKQLPQGKALGDPARRFHGNTSRYVPLRKRYPNTGPTVPSQSSSPPSPVPSSSPCGSPGPSPLVWSPQLVSLLGPSCFLPSRTPGSPRPPTIPRKMFSSWYLLRTPPFHSYQRLAFNDLSTRPFLKILVAL